MSMSGHQSPRAKSVTWLTPPEWIKALGPFDTDPCCPPEMPWPTAKFMFTEDIDGLDQEWRGRVWLNPPFGREWPQWVERLAAYGNGIALIPARTETADFYRLVWGRADAVCFVKGRPHFHREDGTRAPFNSGAPIALVAYGGVNVQALANSGLGITFPIRYGMKPVSGGHDCGCNCLQDMCLPHLNKDAVCRVARDRAEAAKQQSSTGGGFERTP